MYLQQTDVPASSARNATKLLNLHPYTTTVVQKAYETDRNSKTELCELVPSWRAE
jgi:hypothetical protein